MKDIQEIANYINSGSIINISIEPFNKSDNQIYIFFDLLINGIEYKNDLYIKQMPSLIDKIDTLYTNLLTLSFEKKLLFINRPNKKLMFKFDRNVIDIDIELIALTHHTATIEALNSGKKAYRKAWGSDMYLHKIGSEIYLNSNNQDLIYNFNSDDEIATDYRII